MPQNRLTSGGVLATPYGVAVFISYRERDNVYRLKLPFGELYVRGENISPSENEKDLVWQEADSQSKKAMKLNEAYEALEHMRQVNLELTCQELGMREAVDHKECTCCVLEKAKTQQAKASFFGPSRAKADRCLTCGSPSCAKHSSDTYRKSGITLCNECEKVFHMEFILDCMTLDSDKRRERVHHAVDLYDRAALLLKYADQYIDEVADALERTKRRQNAVNFTGSSAGIISGVLGVAAAFAILTPAGPPLIIASLLFGGTSTSIQTGTEVRSQYFLEPVKVCDRILALHGMILSVLTVTGTLRDAALLDHDIARYLANDSPQIADLRHKYVNNREALLAEASHTRDSIAAKTIRVDRYVLGLAAAAAEIEKNNESSHSKKKKKSEKKSENKSEKKAAQATIVARNTRYASRISTGILRTMQYAQFLGGALAAASLLLEAKGMSKTISSIRAGSPCEKAHACRRIQLLMHSFPTTEDLLRECTAYLTYMNERSDVPMSQEEAAQLICQATQDEDDNIIVRVGRRESSSEGDEEEEYEENNERMSSEEEKKSSHSNNTRSTASTTTSSDSSTKPVPFFNSILGYGEIRGYGGQVAPTKPVPFNNSLRGYSEDYALPKLVEVTNNRED